MKFRLLRGTFGPYRGVVYEAGKNDIVESPSDLAKTFKNLFVQVETVGVLNPPAPQPPVVKVVGKQPVVPASPAADAGKGTGPAPEAQSEPSVTSKKKVEIPANGKEVTASFQAAVDNDYRVVTVGKKYFVYDMDHLDKPLNGEGLTKKEVNPFIEKALEG